MEAAPQTGACPAGADDPLGGLSLTDPEIQARHTAFFARMRKEDPVHYDAKLFPTRS